MAKRISRTGAITGLALVAVLSLAGCGAADGSSSSSVETAGGYSSDTFQRTDSGATAEQKPMALAEDVSSEDAGSKSAPLLEDDSAEILTATVALKVEDPSKTAEAIRTMASYLGGKVSYSIERPGSEYDYGSAQLVLRLPPENLQKAIVSLSDHGVVTGSESGSQDVSKQQTDYEVRIESLRTSIARLTGLLAQSQTTAELIEIERELQSRESELESMVAILAELNDQVDLATLTVDITADSKDSQPKKVEPESFITGFERGLEGLMAFGAGLLVFLGLSLPWILVIAIVGSIAMAVLTLARRRRRRRLAAATVSAKPSNSGAVEPTPTPTLEAKPEKGTDGRAEESQNS